MVVHDQLVSDEELTELALAADPDAVVDDEAVSLWDLARDDDDAGLLPDWYMPSPKGGTRRLRGWHRRVAYAVIAAFVLINLAGLCSTYGSIVIA